jgi:hypothetical protein
VKGFFRKEGQIETQNEQTEQNKKKMSGLAIASFILVILSIFSLIILIFFTAADWDELLTYGFVCAGLASASIVTGFRAQTKIIRNGKVDKAGFIFARVGIILSSVELFLISPILLIGIFFYIGAI